MSGERWEVVPVSELRCGDVIGTGKRGEEPTPVVAKHVDHDVDSVIHRGTIARTADHTSYCFPVGGTVRRLVREVPS